MHVPFIGEILCEMGVINETQVRDILEQQKHCEEKFGQIAIRLGLVSAEQVWQAWAQQMAHRRTFIDIAEVGIDVRAVEMVTVPTARALGIIPLYLWQENLFVAGPPEINTNTLGALADQTHCHIHACVTFPESIQYHLDRLDEFIRDPAHAGYSAPAYG